MRRCVRKTIATAESAFASQSTVAAHNAAPRYYDPTGARVLVARYNACSMGISRLHEYGCPIAVSLLLTFSLEGVVVCLIMALLAAPVTVDAILRNLRRHECREQHERLHAARRPNTTAYPVHSDRPLHNATSDPLRYCGYGTIGVRDALPRWDVLSRAYLLPALGTCFEYAPSARNVTASQIVVTGVRTRTALAPPRWRMRARTTRLTLPSHRPAGA
jgi:hypothetical protein